VEACEILGISWMRLTGSSNGPSNGTGPENAEGDGPLCVDEKGMGHGHDYMTIVAQAEEGRPRCSMWGRGANRRAWTPFGRA